MSKHWHEALEVLGYSRPGYCDLAKTKGRTMNKCKAVCDHEVPGNVLMVCGLACELHTNPYNEEPQEIQHQLAEELASLRARTLGCPTWQANITALKEAHFTKAAVLRFLAATTACDCQGMLYYQAYTAMLINW